MNCNNLNDSSYKFRYIKEVLQKNRSLVKYSEPQLSFVHKTVRKIKQRNQSLPRCFRNRNYNNTLTYQVSQRALSCSCLDCGGQLHKKHILYRHPNEQPQTKPQSKNVQTRIQIPRQRFVQSYIPECSPMNSTNLQQGRYSCLPSPSNGLVLNKSISIFKATNQAQTVSRFMLKLLSNKKTHSETNVMMQSLSPPPLIKQRHPSIKMVSKSPEPIVRFNTETKEKRNLGMSSQYYFKSSLKQITEPTSGGVYKMISLREFQSQQKITQKSSRKQNLMKPRVYSQRVKSIYLSFNTKNKI